MKILFVCTGNTCRSPMAEGIMNVKAKEKNLEITAESAGIFAFPGDEASKNAVKAASCFGADISGHRARRINAYMVEEFDFFLCMTEGHKMALSSFVPPEKLLTLGNIPDPYGGDEEVYQHCAERISAELDKFIESFVCPAIHLMTQKDVKAIAEIERLCFSTPWSEEGIREELTNENARFFVFEKQGETVGYMGMHIVLDECYIANIAVLPSHRREGIGQKLLSYGESLAKKESCSFITLEVRVSNSGAIGLYEKNGFERMGERKNFYSDPTENALIMTKNFIKE